MNSIIASNIIGDLSINQKVTSGSCSSVLVSHIDFAVTENKKNYTASNNNEKYLWKIGGKDSPETIVNGPNKMKNSFDQNKNSIGNPYALINGNKEKVIDDGIPTPKIQLYSGKISMEWKQVYKIGAGLNNLGNTCFMNTVIQCLTYCPPLANYLLHDSDHQAKCSIAGFCMMCVMQKHIKRAIGKSGQVIKPLDVYQKLRSIAKHFQFGRQEDAHEFLRYVIDNLWKSCLANHNGSAKLDPASKETTVINQIFGGYHRSQVTCLRCKGKSNTFDHFMDFILDIKQNVMTLEKALEKFTQPELLQLENAYRCPKCKMKVSAQKRFSVYQAPNVATFQLKRFDYHRTFGGKITKQITYSEKLNLRPYMSDSRGDPVWYKLNAVLVHSGPSCNSGHYYCYVRNSNGYWYLMDDQRVHQVSINQVLSESAYVLFYIRMGTSDISSAKKCMDNKPQLAKTAIAALNNKDISSKSLPLSENVQAGTNNSIKLQKYGLDAVNKKTYSPLTQNRDRFSFDIRFKTSIGKDKSELSNSPQSAPKETPAPATIIEPKKTHSGLVPYCKGSSDSSDDEQPSTVVAKTPSVAIDEPKKVISANTSKKHLMENGKSNTSSPTSTPVLDVKAKSSPSVFSMNRSFNNSSNLSNSSVTHKVKATAPWSVSDISMHSPSVGSGSSSTSVNSTTDWNVTTTDPEPPIKKVKDKSSSTEAKNPKTYDSENKNNREILIKNSSTSALIIHDSKKNETPPLSNFKGNKRVTADSKMDSTSSVEVDLNGEKSPTVPTTLTNPCFPNKEQNSDFRKYTGKNEKSFLENGQSSKQEKLSFLKRTHSDANKISESPSKFHGVSESRHSPVFKKAKTTLDDTTEQQTANKRPSINKDLLSISSENNHHKSYSKSSNMKVTSLNPIVHQNGIVDSISERTPNKISQTKKLEDNNCENSQQSLSSSSSSSVEYEWVEKTKETIEKDNKVSLKTEKPEYYKKYHTPSQSKGFSYNVVSELTQNSKYFYGRPVSSWTGENRYIEPHSFKHRNTNDMYDDDDDMDRGKIRKYKKNKRQYFYKENPFQRYQNHVSSEHSSFQDNHRHKDYGQRNFNSHHNWKQPRFHNHNRRKYYYKEYNDR